MKKLFLFLLKKYTKTEEDRLDIIEVLNENVISEYNEQSGYGNVYNANIEFIMANKLIRELVYDKNTVGVNIIKGGLINSFDTAIKYIKNEPRRKKLKKLKKIQEK